MKYSYYTLYLVIPVQIEKDSNEVAVTSQENVNCEYESVDNDWGDAEDLNGYAVTLHPYKLHDAEAHT